MSIDSSPSSSSAAPGPEEAVPAPPSSKTKKFSSSNSSNNNSSDDTVKISKKWNRLSFASGFLMSAIFCVAYNMFTEIARVRPKYWLPETISSQGDMLNSLDRYAQENLATNFTTNNNHTTQIQQTQTQEQLLSDSLQSLSATASEAANAVSDAANAVVSWFGSLSGNRDPHSSSSSSSSTATSSFQWNPATHQQRQLQAQQGLDRMMKDRRAFQLPVTSPDVVLSKGFPRHWEPCALERRLQEKEARGESPSFHVVVVGGSSSSRAGTDCRIENGPLSGGRYSNQLDWRFQTDANAFGGAAKDDAAAETRNPNATLHVKVVNRAQGGMCSVTNALLMDETIDPTITDVIIWEFLINDHHGDAKERVRKLDFWLTRVKANYELIGRPPPAILINFLWTYAAGGGKGLQKRNTLDFFPMREYSEIIDEYRALGWDIAAINVGAVVDAKRLLYNIKAVFDDMHHPSCSGSKLIADMLQYSFYANMAGNCTAPEYAKEYKIDNQTQTILPPIRTVIADISEDYRPLWTDLFRDDGKIGSLSPWEPKVQNRTNLRLVGFPGEMAKWPKTMWGKAISSREDRKYAYKIPSCSNGGGYNLTLLEPDLKWLGISCDTGKRKDAVKIQVNGVVVTGRIGKGWNPAIVYINNWINLETNNVPKADKYEVFICDSQSANIFFGHLIGVMVPNPPITKRLAPSPPQASSTST